MARFTSIRERRLWLSAGVVTTAIYLTLGFANSLADVLGANGLIDILWIAGFIVMTGVVATLALKMRSGPLEIAILVGAVTAFFMVLVRMASPVERSHLFEYSLVAVLIYLALHERRSNGQRVPIPALLAIGATGLLGWLDEGIQWALPNRVYDLRDVGFNALAGVLAVTAAAGVAWVRERRLQGQE